MGDNLVFSKMGVSTLGVMFLNSDNPDYLNTWLSRSRCNLVGMVVVTHLKTYLYYSRA